MEQIKIGTCIPGQQAEQWLPGMKDKGFECFAINFHMTYSGIDLKELAPKVMGMLEGTGTYVSTVGYYCNALQNESQLHDLEYAIDNAHLFGAKTVATFARARWKARASTRPFRGSRKSFPSWPSAPKTVA